jgi:hypothetical protein
MVEQGIEEYMFRAQNLTDYRKAVGVVSTNEKLEDLLSAEPENNVSVGFSIEETVNSSEQEGNLVFYSTTNVLDFLYRGSCFVIINIDFVDDKLAITGYSIIHEGKYLDFIPVEESKGLVWLLADQPSWIYVVTMDNVDVTLEVKLKSRKIEPVYADGKMTLNIDFEFEATQMYLSKDIVMDEYKESKIIDLLEIRILQDIEDTIRKSRSNQCEYLQFKEIFRVKYPNILKRVDWLQTYMESEINISTKVDSKAGVMMDFEAVGKLPKG